MSDETTAIKAGDGDYVFLSYTHKDAAEAKRIVALLEGAGFTVWWDRLIGAGDAFSKATEAALDGASCVVVLWSQQSLDSHWVRDEAQRGQEMGCLVPLSIDGVMPPLGFRQFQFIDVSNWRGSPNEKPAQNIVNAVQAQINSSPMPRAAFAAPVGNAPSGFTLSRRNLAIGGGAIVGIGALAGWGLMGSGSASAQSMSLAVLPFDNLSADEEQAWFSNGLSNELRAALARNPRLKVSAPTSSKTSADQIQDQFELARQLGVEHVLRGSVQLADSTTRISVELVQLADGLVRWAQSFDRTLEDIFAVQTEIAQTVAVSLVRQIASEEETQQAVLDQAEVGGTSNIAAYEAYLRGHAFFDLSAGVESDRAALAQFEAAIAADPNYAAAHAMKSTMYAAVANATSQASEVNELYDLAIEAAARAIELEPKLAIGHLALGFAYNNGRLDRASARPHYQSAWDLAPGSADTVRSVAVFFAFGDERAQAREMIDQVLELDPLNARAFRSAGYIALLSRDYPVVLERMARALELNPKIASAHYAVGTALYLQDKPREALDAFSQEPVSVFAQTGQAMAYNKLGDVSSAQDALAGLLEEYGDAGLYQQAQIRAQWGQSSDAIDLLSRALEASDPGILFLPNDPILDPLRGDPDFEALRSRVSV